MSSNYRVKNAKIFEIGQKIGLNKKEIENILTNTSSTIELTSQLLGSGPNEPYWASMYGSISTKDFQ